MNAVPNNAMPSTNLAFEPAGPMELKRILGAYFTAAPTSSCRHCARRHSRSRFS